MKPNGDLRDIFSGKLMPDAQASAFRSADKLFPTRTVLGSSQPYPLPVGPTLGNVDFTSKGVDYDLYDYVSLNRVSGLLVIKDGQVRFETYQLGNSRHLRWLSMSIAKTITSTLIGAALYEGFIKSIDEHVVNYVPDLIGSAYDGVTIRHVLQMRSGVRWNEDYEDPCSDRRRMLELQMLQKPGTILAYMAQRSRAASPGVTWNYSTGETYVLAAVLAAAVQRPLATYLSERIWSRFGMEDAATWWLDSPDGLEVGGNGFSATLRDFARFGIFLLHEGKIGSEMVLPHGWMEEATASPSALNMTMGPYGYMLWPIPSAEGADQLRLAFEARGIFGQHLYVNRSENLVIAVWGSLPKAINCAPIVDRDFFAAIARQLRN